MKTNVINLLGLLLVLSLSTISCSDSKQEFTNFENQNIPQNLCGTYYQVERGENYYQYLTINPDGTMEGIYVSGGKSTELRGECYYKEGRMIFYYNNGNNWSQLYGSERTVVEWTSEYMVLGYFNASILTKSKQTPSFIDDEHDENLIGKWIYNQTETATTTFIFDKDGTGSQEFSSPIDYHYHNIVSWFTFNEWLYIKYEGKSDYEIWRYNLSGKILYLYYCDILGYDNYNYHKDNTPEDDEADGTDDNLNPEGTVPSSNDYGVDLGLSVYWADYNVGSTESTEVGGCYGWGDATGTYYTKDETMYPSANPPSDISGTEYDIASNKWGNGWRIPTKKEMKELIDNCDITWQNWCNCWEFTSKINGNSIKLPYASVRNGKSTFYNECGYWTSTLDRAYMGAYALYALKSGGDIDNINHFKRSYGLQIRPVKDKNDTDLSKIILGSWTVLMDDPSWKVAIQLKANGICQGTDWYDIEGDNTFSEKEGTWEGTYSLSTDEITFSANSVIAGSYTFTSVSSTYFEAADEDGWKIYATKK